MATKHSDFARAPGRASSCTMHEWGIALLLACRLRETFRLMLPHRVQLHGHQESMFIAAQAYARCICADRLPNLFCKCLYL